jgi:hypothetical protein
MDPSVAFSMIGRDGVFRCLSRPSMLDRVDTPPETSGLPVAVRRAWYLEAVQLRDLPLAEQRRAVDRLRRLAKKQRGKKQRCELQRRASCVEAFLGLADLTRNV